MSLLTRIQSAGMAFAGNSSATIPTQAGFANLEPKIESEIDAVMRAVPMPVKRWWDAIGMRSHFRPNKSMEQYSENVWLYSAIFLIATEIARTKFFMEFQREDDTTEKKFRHQALSTLQHPMGVRNLRSHLTGCQLMQQTIQHLLLTGDAFWVLDNTLPIDLGGSPMALLPLIPSGVEIKLDKENMLDKYIYRTPDKEIKYPAEEVVHFKLMHPEDMYRGHSVVQPEFLALNTYKKAEELSFFKLENMAIPAGLLESDKPIPRKQRVKILQEFLSMFKGTKNTQRTGMLPWGLKFKKVQESSQELQQIEGQDQRRDEILAGVRTGKGLMGLTEDQSRANAEAQNFVWQRFNILPLLEVVNDTLSNDYLPAFANTEGWDMGFEDPVPENKEEKRENIAMMLEGAAITIDEAREAFGFKPLNIIGISDVPLANINKVPVDQLNSMLIPEDNEPEEKPKEDEE